MSRIPKRHHINTENLRIVETVDSEHDLNKAIENGHVTLFRKIERNPKLYSRCLLLRNYRSGLYEEVPSRSFYTRHAGKQEFPESEWECMHRYDHYHRERRADKAWAAYVLPLLPVIGERFYIEDIIEDIFVQGFCYKPISAYDGEAVWNGKDLELDEAQYAKSHIVG